MGPRQNNFSKSWSKIPGYFDSNCFRSIIRNHYEPTWTSPVTRATITVCIGSGPSFSILTERISSTSLPSIYNRVFCPMHSILSDFIVFLSAALWGGFLLCTAISWCGFKTCLFLACMVEFPRKEDFSKRHTGRLEGIGWEKTNGYRPMMGAGPFMAKTT